MSQPSPKPLTAQTDANRRGRRRPEPVHTPRRWATVYQAADYMGVGAQTIREWIVAGKFNGYKINARVIRVDLNEVDAAFVPFGGDAA